MAVTVAPNRDEGTPVAIANDQLADYRFLSGMYGDPYFPNELVDQGAAVLGRLCERIEAERPVDVEALYVLTRAATEEFNALQAAFEAAGSELETVAREAIAEDFWFIAKAYGFTDANVEKLIGSRDW